MHKNEFMLCYIQVLVPHYSGAKVTSDIIPREPDKEQGGSPNLLNKV